MPSLNGENERASERPSQRTSVSVWEWERERMRATNNNNITSVGVSVFCLFVSHFFTLMKHTHYTHTQHSYSHTHTQQNRGAVALERFVFANSHGIVVYVCVCMYWLLLIFIFLSRIPAHFFSSLLRPIQVGCDARTLARTRFFTFFNSFFPRRCCAVLCGVYTFLTFIASVLSRQNTNELVITVMWSCAREINLLQTLSKQ